MFLHLCAHFHQDVDVVYSDPPEAMAAFVANEPDAEVQNLLAYLRTDLLRQEPEQVQATWDSCGSDLIPEDAGAFLDAVADATDRALQERGR